MQKWILTQGSPKKSSFNESYSKEGSSINIVQKSEMINVHISTAIAHQQKQLDKLTTMTQQISKATQNSSLTRRGTEIGRGLVCYSYGKPSHINRNYWHRKNRSSLNPQAKRGGFSNRCRGRVRDR